jgi:hypothetical protein
MSKLITIRAYKFAELSDKAKDRFVNEMYSFPFEYEAEDEEGNTIIKYDYFGDMDLEMQIEYCDDNKHLFDKYGELVGHLEEFNDD